jgi:SAM-dependent methyltransferase
MNANGDRNRQERTRALYSRHPFGDFSYAEQRHRHNRPLSEFLRTLSRDGTVYDIGCGTGYWTEQAVRSGIPRERLVALDLAPRNAAVMRSKGFNAVCGDVLSLPLKDNVADVAICNGVIHHVPKPRQAYRELVRITKPGGMIFLAVYNRWNPYFYLVHRCTAPLRYAYWHWDKRVLDWVTTAAQPLFQPLAYCFLGAFLDRQTGRTMMADQVMVPYAHLYSKQAVRRYAHGSGCSVMHFGHAGARMMLTAVIRVDKPHPPP